MCKELMDKIKQVPIMDKNKYVGFGNGIFGGIVGAILIIAIAVAVCIWKNPFDYKAVVIVQQEQLNANSGPILTMPEATLLNSLREKGVLLTPSEYTNNIVSYYNTLIAFLSVFFVVFTIFGYYVVRNQSKKEVRDEARDILLESTTFKNQVVVNIRGEFDQLYLSHEEYDETLKDMKEDIATLKNNKEEKEEVVPATEVVKKETVSTKPASRTRRKKVLEAELNQEK